MKERCILHFKYLCLAGSLAFNQTLTNPSRHGLGGGFVIGQGLGINGFAFQLHIIFQLNCNSNAKGAVEACIRGEVI